LDPACPPTHEEQFEKSRWKDLCREVMIERKERGQTGNGRQLPIFQPERAHYHI